MRFKTKLESYNISEKCVANIYVTEDNCNYVFEVIYGDNFKFERLFLNNDLGMSKMEECKDKYKTESKVLEYFGLK